MNRRKSRFRKRRGEQKKEFRSTHLASHELGNAWAGNTINTVIFRHHGVLTYGEYQFAAFYVDENTLRLVRRNLVNEVFEFHDIHGYYKCSDAHNSISMGVDGLGHLHISYDHHASQLRYRRSIHLRDIGEWTDELPMTGLYEEKVTYPAFILPRQNFPLTFLYRDGVADNGSAHLKTYDESTKAWSDHPQAILSGADQRPWTSNAYWNHPAVGTDGSIHLSFVWRTNALGDEQHVNNINVCYACSRDNGLSWETSLGRPYKMPITQVNVETIYSVSPGSNLINQCSMALDSLSRPHVVFYSDDSSGIPQYQHLWFDGKIWHHQIDSKRTQAFALQGGGTLLIPTSRPEIVLDRQDNAYIISRGDHTRDRMSAICLTAPDYICWPHIPQILTAQDLGFAEPVIDRVRWHKDNALTLLLQRNEQPDHYTNHQPVQHVAKVVDIKFSLIR